MGVTALYAAAEMGHVVVVRRLVMEGADVRLVSGNRRWTPVQVARFKGRDEVVAVLMQAEVGERGGLAMLRFDASCAGAPILL